MTLITDEIRSLVGVVGPLITAPERVERDALRRFVQASMDLDDIYWDEAAAASTRFGHVVAPPLYPMHAFRLPAGSPDPLDRLADDPDWDGIEASGIGSLPPIELPLQRLLNGGTGAEVFALAKVGDLISMQARYLDIAEKEASSGPMVIVRIGTDYTTEQGDLLLRTTQTILRR